MVKFGRHVDFFVANELESSARHRLFVVPYKEVQHKTMIEVPRPPAPPANTPTPTRPLQGPARPAQRREEPVRAEQPRQQPQHHQPQQQRQQHQYPQKPAPTQPQRQPSGLSALFDDPAISPGPLRPKADAGGSDQSGNFIDSVIENMDNENIIENIDDVAHSRKNAVTLNAATGDELAAAVRHLLVTSRKDNKNPYDPNALLVPTDYGYDDPCNDDIPEASSVEAEREVEAQARFFAERFKVEWRACLRKASADFDTAMQLFWSEVFEGITSYHGSNYQNGDHRLSEEKDQAGDFEEALRGALPDKALQMYVAAVPPERAQGTFSFLKDIHATALINAEALRKLVKKFDKMHYRLDPHSYLLSAKLLPEVYSSNFTGSLASLEAGLALLRVLLNIEEDDNNSLPDGGNEPDPKAIQAENKRLKKLATVDDDLRDVAVLSGGYFGNKKDTDAELHMRRKEELQWLRKMVDSIDPVYIPFLVAHRGFHSIHDRNDVRPLENSLMSYEAAWTNGVHLCECDIALTKDERIILAHDENFARLGMDPASPLCNRTVRDLTFKELMNCPLKSGARPPLLFDVLRSAAAIGDDAKMIVEIKAGNAEAGPALARLFLRHPELMVHVAVVMSFDAFIMHNLRREMAVVFDQLHDVHHHQQQNLIPSPPPHDVEENTHPMKAPHLSSIALGSILSSSPHLGPSIKSHHRIQSQGRFLSVLGGRNRQDSLDMLGLGHQPMDFRTDKADSGLGMNLGEIDNTMSSSSTFLPIPTAQINPQQQQEEKVSESKEDPSDFPASSPIKSFPKLLLITVAETPKADYELFVDITKPEKVAELDGWLRGGDGGTLDGVYMQYQKSMLGLEGSKAMRGLASRYEVGIWGANPVPDDWDTFHSLVTECQVSYFNTSLPKHFRRKMKRSMSANTLAMNGILSNHSSDYLVR